MDRWEVYIVLCLKDFTLYTGIARDARQRLVEHNAGKGAKYTRGRGPIILKYVEIVSSKGDALRREAQIKKMSRYKKERLIKENPHGVY